MRRTKFDIIAEILNFAREATLKTPILFNINLSHNQLCEYSCILQENNLLTLYERNEQKFYKTTPRGLKFLEEYRELRKLFCINESEQMQNQYLIALR